MEIVFNDVIDVTIKIVVEISNLAEVLLMS